MLKPIIDEKEIGRILEGLTEDQFVSIIKSGPLMGILAISCFIKRGGKTPIPSVVSAKVTDCTFHYWDTIENYMKEFLGDEYQNIEIADRSLWVDTVIKLCEDNQLIYSFCIALFLQAQMQVFSTSPYPAQEIVLQLLEPIFSGSEFFDDYDSPSIFSGPNAKFYITLHAGHHPLVQTNFPYETLINWQNELEAAMVLSLPQIVRNAILELPSPNDLFLKEMIHNEILVWHQNPPKFGEVRQWSWLPHLD